MPVVTDDFNRVDSADLGSLNWTQQYGGGTGGSMGITASKAGPPTNTSDVFGDHYSGATFAADQYAQVNGSNTLGNAPTRPMGGPAVRCSGTSSATSNGYNLFYAGGNVWELEKVINGAETLLQFPIVTAADNDLEYLEARGTTLKMFRNGTQLGTSQTDSSIASGAPGIMGLGGGVQVDNFEGGDFSVVVAAAAKPIGPFPTFRPDLL